MKSIFLFLFCSFVLMSNAQNNILTISPIYAINFRNIPFALYYKRTYYPQKLSYSLGLNSSIYFSKNRIAVDVSVLYYSLNYRNTTSYSYFLTKNLTNIIFDLTYLKFPIGVNYIVYDKKLKLELALGLSASFLINSEEQKVFCYNCSPSKSYSNLFAFSTYLGTKFKINIYKKFDLTTQPTLDFYMNGFDKIKPNRILVPSIYFGVGYTFTGRKDKTK